MVTVRLRGMYNKQTSMFAASAYVVNMKMTRMHEEENSHAHACVHRHTHTHLSISYILVSDSFKIH